MTKRIIALFLCLTSLVAVLAGCGGKIDPTSENKGQQITMYLTETVYDLDPAHAYMNESSRSIVSLLFDTLFVLDEKGKVKPSLASGYTIKEDANADEYYMYIDIASGANWSDNTPVTADDAVYAWKRILSYKNSFETASLLYDIKNARAYSEGEVSKDDIGLTADGKRITIQFEKPIDYDQFILNLTSLALAPLRENIVEKGPDWAKKPGTMVCSGPFKLARISFAINETQKYADLNYDVRYKINDKNYYVAADPVRDGAKNVKEQVVTGFVLERNSYYYRNSEKDEKLDKTVVPYRIIVDCAMSDEDIKEAYEGGTILYIGDIPMSLSNDLKDSATIKDSLSTNSLYFNQNATIGGQKLFAIKEVRQALSMAIDREAIATALVFAEAATGFVPTGVYDTSSISAQFRDVSANDFKYLTKNMDEAKKLLANAGIKASDFSFSVSYPAYDEVHAFVAEAVVAAWNELGFDVELKKRGTVTNNDYYKHTDSVPEDICDDLFAEDFRGGNFEVAIFDYVAVSADPFSVLAPFAKQFSGQSMDMSVADHYELAPHLTGYDSQEYNDAMEAVFQEKTIANRSELLHNAEAILMEDMPVCPIVFNQTAYVISDDLSMNNKSQPTNYYGSESLKRINVKKYDAYIATCSAFLESKFDEYRANPLSYFGSESFREMTFEMFKEESSNYAYLFKVYEEETKEKKK